MHRLTKYAIPGITAQFASHSFHSAAGHHNLFTVGGPLHRSQRTCNGRQKSHSHRASSLPFSPWDISCLCWIDKSTMQWHNKVDGIPEDVWDLWHWRKEGIPPGRLYEWTRHRKQRREEEARRQQEGRFNRMCSKAERRMLPWERRIWTSAKTIP